MKAEKKEIRWTPRQTQALNARNVGLAVSAAAGSGKTAVLTERIVRLLSEDNGVDVSELCVVTFTKAAAGELETKLYEALTRAVAARPGDKRLAGQLFRLDRAHISTIDSFCLDLVRAYRRELGLRPGVRVCEETEEALLLREAREEGLDAFLADPRDRDAKRDFYALFCDAKKRDGLWAVLDKMKEKADASAEGTAFFRERLEILGKETDAVARGERSFYDTRVGRALTDAALTDLDGEIERMRFFTESIAAHPALDKRRCDLEDRLAKMEEARKALAGGEAVRAGLLIEELRAPKLATVSKLTEEDKALADGYKDAWNALKKRLGALAESYLCVPWQERQADLETFLPLATALITLFETVSALFAEKKRDRNVLSFADLSGMTLRLVGGRRDGGYVPTETGREIARRFKAVFVDEYQDTNSVQDAIFRCITDHRNLFLVGDPKQCVYHFRGAEPEVFIRYRRSLPAYPTEPEEEMARHSLSENFRCDPPIIDFVNALFRVLMDAAAPETLYGSDDELKPGKDKEDYRHLPVEIALLDKPKKDGEKETAEEKDDKDAEDREAVWIARRIRAILDGEITRADGARYEPEDIAVIARTWRQVERVKDALRSRGIPAAWTKGDGGSAAPEEFFVTSLLRAADNPTRDVPLLAALYSPVFRFSPDDLFRLRKDHPGVSFFAALSAGAAEDGPAAPACRRALEALGQLRRAARTLTPTELIFYIYREFAVEELYRETSPADSAVRLRFLRLARAAESAGFTTLERFCGYLANAKEKEGGTAEEQGVRLMTIHKAKGLEYPVVFVSFLSGSGQDARKGGSVRMSSDYGVTFPLPLWGGVSNREHLLTDLAKRQAEREEREEDLRVLYVALTRARDKLIITGAPRGFSSLRSRTLFPFDAPFSPRLSQALLRDVINPMELIFIGLHESPALRDAMATGKGEEKDLTVSLETVDPDREENAVPAPFIPERSGEPLPPWDEVLPSLNFTYAHPERETLPKKLSVSEIIRQHREEEEQLFPRTLTDFERGILRADAAFRGTAIHQAMQFADLEAAAKDPEGEIRRLLREGFITKKMEREIDRAHFSAFFKSDLYRRVAASPRVVHEKRFNVLLPADELLGRPGQVLIQGVVDLWFEKEDGTLAILDFKTDRLPPDGDEVLIERHGEQLRIYRRAVEAIEEKRVTELLLYSFSLDRPVPVPLEP